MFTFNADALRMASPVASLSSAEMERECELQEMMAAAWREEHADGRVRRAREALHHHHCSLVPPFYAPQPQLSTSSSSAEGGSKRASCTTQQQQAGGKCSRSASSGANANGSLSVGGSSCCSTCEICTSALGMSATSRSDAAAMTSLKTASSTTQTGGGTSPNAVISGGSGAAAVGLYVPALVLLAEELAPTVTEAERLYRLALRHAETQLKRSTALAHQSPAFESLHSAPVSLQPAY